MNISEEAQAFMSSCFLALKPRYHSSFLTSLLFFLLFVLCLCKLTRGGWGRTEPNNTTSKSVDLFQNIPSRLDRNKLFLFISGQIL
jgi:hypothetical protein